MAKKICISPIGRLGNWMFQYLLARILQSYVPEAVISGLNLPQFGIETDVAAPESADGPQIAILGHRFRFTDTIAALKKFDNITVNIGWVCMRMEYYRRHLDLARRLFPIDPSLQMGFDDRHLVINIRAEEVLKGGHPNYTLLPIAWYRHLIETCGLNPIFMGQIGEDPYSSALRRDFSTARFITHTNPLDDFNMIRTSTNVVLSVSSFSWLAAWLSISARRIVLPMIGLFNPLDRLDVDVLPVRDCRYQFHRFPSEIWTASTDQLAAKINGPVDKIALQAQRFPRLIRARSIMQRVLVAPRVAGGRILARRYKGAIQRNSSLAAKYGSTAQPTK